MHMKPGRSQDTQMNVQKVPIHRPSNGSETAFNHYSKKSQQWIPMAPPDYYIDPSYLIDSFVQKHCWYHSTNGIDGTLSDIQPQNRNFLLRFLDQNGGINSSGQIRVNKHSNSHDVSRSYITPSFIRVCARDINIRSSTDERLQMIPIDLLLTLSYVKDENHHILFLLHKALSNAPFTQKVVDKQYMLISILLCESRLQAEELASLIKQAINAYCVSVKFHQYDQQISRTLSSIHQSASVVPIKQDMSQNYEVNSTISSSFTSKSSIEMTPEGAAVLKDYMNILRKDLTKDEFKQYLTLLEGWKSQLIPFREFCRNTYHLLGWSRLDILRRMRYFLSENEKQELVRFVEREVHSSATLQVKGFEGSDSESSSWTVESEYDLESNAQSDVYRTVQDFDSIFSGE